MEISETRGEGKAAITDLAKSTNDRNEAIEARHSLLSDRRYNVSVAALLLPSRALAGEEEGGSTMREGTWKKESTSLDRYGGWMQWENIEGL